MHRRSGWVIEGVHVLRSDVARWMGSVGCRCPEGQERKYMRDYRLSDKIAALKAAGRFESVMASAAMRLGVAVPPVPSSDDASVPLPWDELTAANEGEFDDAMPATSSGAANSQEVIE